MVAEDAVDVMMEGYVFRIGVYYDKDPTRAMTSKADAQLGSVPTDQDLLLRTSHASLLQGLHGVHPAYGPSVRLAKRWVWSHLFSDALTEEVVELLVAYAFGKSAPQPPPSSRVTGFLRYFKVYFLDSHVFDKSRSVRQMALMLDNVALVLDGMACNQKLLSFIYLVFDFWYNPRTLSCTYCCPLQGLLP